MPLEGAWSLRLPHHIGMSELTVLTSRGLIAPSEQHCPDFLEILIHSATLPTVAYKVPFLQPALSSVKHADHLRGTMVPFKTVSKVQHITSVLWVAASHYLQEERLSDKAPANQRSAGQFPWKIQFREASRHLSTVHSAQQTIASRNMAVKIVSTFSASMLETAEESTPSFLKWLQKRPNSGNELKRQSLK